MAKNSLYDHCDVDTVIDKENQTVTVNVTFKEHMSDATRVRYLWTDVQQAISQKGIPVQNILSNGNRALDNDIPTNTSATYVFSLGVKEKTPQRAKVVASKTKTTKNKSETPTQSKKTATNS